MSNNNFDGDLEKFVKRLFGDKTKKNSKNVEAVDAESATIKKEKQPKNMRKWATSALIITAVFVMAIIAFANLYIVKENEYKIVRQFGEVVKYESEPGLHMKIPFIQSVTTLPKNLMTYDMMQEEINTKDKKRIIIDNYAVWRVIDPKALISSAGTLPNAERRMSEFIYSVIRTELGKLDYDQIINAGDSSRGDINDSVTLRVNELLANDNYGIEVIDVRIRRTDLPPENEQAIFTRMISEREKTAQTYLSQGDAEKRAIEASTDREVQTLLAKANREAAVIIAEGEAEAAKIYNDTFSQDPEFYSLYRTLESYKKTIGDDTVIIIPSDSPYAKILSGYLE
ncbi:protease modulator HflC [Metasolibacillus meyeri]|uniref:Protein HflC n=1 Tax=Metasolibacillus meyeri TaxID=1071052 RepID=A0AAW9NV68_9BACL|nr:protease modulator HflC [Metasolibacillus meyeri]MEC1180411.1 protease modulator HflC [Metasolibacillus meyeri]